jgi:hypothetical protein
VLGIAGALCEDILHQCKLRGIDDRTQ